MSKPYPPQLEIDPAQYKKVLSDLQSARRTILELMGPELNFVLESYTSCETRVDAQSWESLVAETVIEQAKVLPADEGSYWRDRAYCPLCQQGSHSFYEGGYALPEGLRRHLVGWGNSQQCPVMEAAMELARDYWKKRFHAEEEAEKAARLMAKEYRLKSEILYLTKPNAPPKLLEHDSHFFNDRNQDQIQWAEARLSYLGFRVLLDGNVKTYIDDREKLIVYADLTPATKIVLRAYQKPLPKRGSPSPINIYEVRDQWKHDLKAKYENWLIFSLQNRK